jgi:hypothetical protein
MFESCLTLGEHIAVDNELPNELGRTVMVAISVTLTILTLTFVGGLPLFIASLLVLGAAFLSKSSWLPAS